MASRGVNKVILLGNLGADPDCKQLPSGDMVANFSLATSESWIDRNTQQNVERTEWHRCVAFRGLAGVIQQYVRKGSKIYVEGRLQTRSWQDNTGQTRYTTEIVVDQMQMLDSRSGGSANWDNQSPQNSGNYNRSNNDYGGYNEQYGNLGNNYSGHNGARNHQPIQPVPPQQQARPIPGPDPDAGFEDDSIPF